MFDELERASGGQTFNLIDVLSAIPWGSTGLIAAIAQQHDTGEVLMLAWMNREALEETIETGFTCYWSRSRQSLWRKGETSGCRQKVVDMRLDCDGDAVLLRVDQTGPACHTGRRSCFYNSIRNNKVVVFSNPKHSALDKL